LKPIVLRALIDDWGVKVESLGKLDVNAAQLLVDFREKHGYQESTVGPGAVIRSPRLVDENGTLYVEGKIRTRRIRANLEKPENVEIAECIINELGYSATVEQFVQFEQIVEKELESTVELYKRGENEEMRERIPSWGKYGV